ncbi:SEFIR domain-containing protein [Bradyrhizobium sp. HKCCYLS20291]|uniref:SEFIR domain-containing protein n=1 Tax=Bradyrhizobium sp. HKCCYLS20291 TaxID=3420766 RepID=UPI003EC0AF75
MPKTFISYSWSSKEREQWVLEFATALRESGVDVVLDKWDLKEGHDVVAFMERMGTDKDIEKVIMIFDRRYVEKANDRTGGVGTEAQIITSQIYERSDQDKFIGIVAEVNPEGRPYKPIYYASRLHIDLSDQDTYAENFDQLLRWVFGKPAYPKPPLGRPPEFLNDSYLALPTRSRAHRATTLIRSASPAALGALQDYLESLSDSFNMIRIEGATRDDFDEEVVKSIGAFTPYRDEYLSVLSTLVKAPPSDDSALVIKRFFERLIPFMTRPKGMMSWSEDWFDNYRFIIHELFLYTVASLLKNERFAELLSFIGDGFYAAALSQDGARTPIQDFTLFRTYLPSLARRNVRLELRRLSVRADLLRDRVPPQGVNLDDLMQADLVLFLRAAAEEHAWWPETLIWASRQYSPFELFARATSARYLQRLLPVLGVSTPEDLHNLINSFYSQQGLSRLPKWEFDTVELKRLTGAAELGRRP